MIVEIINLAFLFYNDILKITYVTMASLSAAFSCRLFSVLRFESVIHEFDPYFNYRTTKFLAEEGFYNFHNWFDDRAWYPLGRIIGGKNNDVIIGVEDYHSLISPSLFLLSSLSDFKTSIELM